MTKQNKNLLVDQKKFDRMSKKMLSNLQKENFNISLNQSKDMLAQIFGFENEFQIQNQIFNSKIEINDYEVKKSLYNPWVNLLLMIENNLVIISQIDKSLDNDIKYFLEQYRIFNLCKMKSSASETFKMRYLKTVPFEQIYVPIELFESLQKIFSSSNYYNKIKDRDEGFFSIDYLYNNTKQIGLLIKLLKEFYTVNNTFISQINVYEDYLSSAREIYKKLKDPKCRDIIKTFFNEEGFYHDIERFYIDNKPYDYYCFEDEPYIFYPDGTDFHEEDGVNHVTSDDLKNECEIIVIEFKCNIEKVWEISRDSFMKQYPDVFIEEKYYSGNRNNENPKWLHFSSIKNIKNIITIKKYIKEKYGIHLIINEYEKSNKTNVKEINDYYNYDAMHKISFYKK